MTQEGAVAEGGQALGDMWAETARDPYHIKSIADMLQASQQAAKDFGCKTGPPAGGQ